MPIWSLRVNVQLARGEINATERSTAKTPACGRHSYSSFFYTTKSLDNIVRANVRPGKMQRWLCLAVDWPQRGLLIARRRRQESGHVDRGVEPGRSGRHIYMVCAARQSTAAPCRFRCAAARCAKETRRGLAPELTRSARSTGTNRDRKRSVGRPRNEQQASIRVSDDECHRSFLRVRQNVTLAG